MIYRIYNKILRELYRFRHPLLWGKRLQINGIPQIYEYKKLKIGKDVSLNKNCFFQCQGGIVLEDRVTISRNVTIFTQGLKVDDYRNNSRKRYREHEEKPVIIEEGTWIATNVIILPGTKIAKESVVGAGAVVTHSLEEPGCLYAGIPAKKVRKL